MKEYRDHYFLKAKRENYPARSVYKLKELDAKFRLLKPGMKVLDLGAAPGSWSLGVAEKVGSKGLVLACDIQSTETAFPPQVLFMQEDVFQRSAAFEAKLAELGPFDLVISDMAPRTTFPGADPGGSGRSLPASEARRQFCGQDLHGTGYSGSAHPHAQGVQLGQIL